MHHLASQHFGQKTCHVSHYPTDRLDRRQTCHEPDRLPVEALELPPRATVDRLLEAYFAHANPGFPVVDEDLFWEQYRARDPGNPPSLLLLHAMLVVGAHVLYAPGPGVDSQEEQGLRASAKATFFRRAKALFDARFERNRDTLVQAALLLTWHTDGPEDVAANAWFWVGVALRTATGLGMHRDAEGSTVVAHNRRMWRRVWWLLVRCDVALALQYGRPRCVRLDECDVRPVEPADFAHCGPATEVAYVTHSIELAVLASRMLDCRFPLASAPSSSYFPSYCTPAPQASPDAVIRELNHALARWSLDLPDELGPRPGRSLGLWPAYLQLQYNTLLILVHRAPPWQQQRSSHDANVCAVAAGCIVSLLQTIRDAGGLRSLWLSAANSIFTALIQMDAQVRESSPALAVPALTQYDAAVALLREFADLWPNSLPILHFFEHLRTPGRRVGTPADAVARGEAGEAVGGEEDADDLPRKNSEDGLEPVFEEGPHDISEAWNEWRSAHWQDIDMDEMPFIF